MLGLIEGTAQYKKGRTQLGEICALLVRRATIPQVKQKLELIRTVQSETFWQKIGLLDLERVRQELRELVKFTVDDEGGRRVVYTNLTDEVMVVREGETLGPAYNFDDYKLKVNRYIEHNRDHIAIYKLRHNIPLTMADYESLEQIFTGELGTAEDYRREFQDTPFGLLVRRIAKLEYDAAMQAFSEFINDQSLTQAQIVFVRKVIDYIVQNGYIEHVSDLLKAPFDKPQSFVKLFDEAKRQRLVEVINQVRDNAVKVVG
jgi:type I restriction enzyme R subunit